MENKYKQIIGIKAALFCLLAVLSIQVRASEGTIALKGEDFPGEKNIPIFCKDSVACVVFKDEVKKSAVVDFVGQLDGKTLHLQIEVPATPGPHKLKLDKDGDQKPGERIYLEIYGSNPAVDKVVYTLEDESDDATVTISDISESDKIITASFSGRFFDSATGVKRVQINGNISVK